MYAEYTRTNINMDWCIFGWQRI